MSTILGVLKVIAYVILGFTAYQFILRLVRRNWHFPAPSFIAIFLNSRWRARLQDPRVVIARSGVRSGNQVLDVGCGGGFFLPYAAEAVGAGGKVDGLDISGDMLELALAYLGKWPVEVRERVSLLQKSAYDLPFAAGSLDVVYSVAALMEIPDPQRCLAEVRRVLKPGGILAVSEFLPDPDYPGRKATIRCGELAGFTLDAVEGNLWNYTVRFKNNQTGN